MRAPSMADVSSGPWARRLAWALGMLLTALVLELDLTYQRHAGPLWRDEANSANVVDLPSAREVFGNMHRDSFPAAWITVLYGWKRMGLGDTDPGLRRLGLLIGVALVGVIWWTGWRLGIGPPLVTLALVGMSPTVVVYGGEVRGYGLAAVAMGWCLGALWWFVRSPGRRSFCVALLATVAAAQTHYLNCVLLVGVGGAAAVLCGRRRDGRTFFALVLIGLVAGISLVAVNCTALHYMTGTTPLEQGDWSLASVSRVLLRAFAPGVPVLAGLWIVAALAGIAGLLLAWTAPRAPGDVEQAIFVTMIATTAPVLALLAIWQGGLPSQSWYYLSVMLLLGFSCDVGTHLLVRRFPSGEWLRLATVGLGALLARPALSDAVAVRMTNVDVIAERIAARAAADDLVVVFPWYCGISFERHYRGKAPWITLPDFEEHRFHLHALVAEKMKLGEAAIHPELARVEETLRRGNAVWIVGQLVAPDPGHSPPPLAPAPTGPRGWRAAPYLDTWELRLGELVEGHVEGGQAIPVFEEVTKVAIQRWERLPLTRVVGWR